MTLILILILWLCLSLILSCLVVQTVILILSMRHTLEEEVPAASPVFMHSVVLYIPPIMH